MLLYSRLAPPKTPKRRSRAGCSSCKEKKKKCNEERPECSRCAERGFDCVYDFVKPHQRRRRGSTVSNGISRRGRLVDRPSQAPARKLSEDSLESDSSGPADSLPDWEGAQGNQLRNSDVHQPDVLSPLDGAFDTDSIAAFPTTDATTTLSPVSSVSCNFPLGFIEDETSEDTDVLRASRRFWDVDRGLEFVAPSSSVHADLAMSAPSLIRSPLAEFCGPAYVEFSEMPNRRALVDHFCSVLSHLIVLREETGNPFQQLVLPLTQRSSCVTSAIYALASAHLEYRGVENKEKSIYFYNQAILGLAKMFDHDGKVNRNELLATIMLLVYYEVLVQKGRSNIVGGHLKGALTIMVTDPEASDHTAVFLERAFRFYDVIAALSLGTPPLSTAPAAGCLLPFPPLGALAASPLSNVDTLLGMATTLWPIIHRLSSLLSLRSDLEKALRTGQTAPKVAVLRTEFQSTADATESALKQWAPCLPPNYTRDPKDCTKVTVKPPLDDADALRATAEKARLHSILNNALAYRHSAFVYLYRTVFGHERSHPAVQAHAHASLTHCEAAVAHAGPMGALLWPLFVASCEAASAADRELTRRAFAAIDKRQGMMNIERAWDIVREVWRRADGASVNWEDQAAGRDGAMLPGFLGRGTGGKGADLWRRVSEDMGVSIVFG